MFVIALDDVVFSSLLLARRYLVFLRGFHGLVVAPFFPLLVFIYSFESFVLLRWRLLDDMSVSLRNIDVHVCTHYAYAHTSMMEMRTLPPRFYVISYYMPSDTTYIWCMMNIDDTCCVTHVASWNRNILFYFRMDCTCRTALHNYVFCDLSSRSLLMFSSQNADRVCYSFVFNLRTQHMCAE